MREEAGLAVDVGGLLDEHLFEVLPQRFVRIVAYGCTLIGTADITLSDEHLRTYWAPVTELAELMAGHRLPPGYLNAIKTALR